MAAELSISAVENAPVAMKSLFVTCTRYRDLHLAEDPVDDPDHEDFFPYIRGEIELTAQGAQAGVLSNGTWGWTELYSFIEGNIVWFSPEVFIVGGDLWDDLECVEGLGFHCVLNVFLDFYDDTDGVQPVRNPFRTFASSLAQARVGCARILDYLSSASCGGALSFSPGNVLRSRTFPVSGAVLSRFLTKSRLYHGSRHLILNVFTSQCQVLAAIEPTYDLDIELHFCRPITDEGASALVEGVRNSRGPSAFSGCDDIDNYLLVEALAGNTNVKMLKPEHAFHSLRHRVHGDGAEIPPLPMQALAENLGLVELSFFGHCINDETLSVMCESLSTHPTVEFLDVRYTLPSPDNSADDDEESISAVNLERRKTSRTNALVDMLRSNTKITSIGLTRDDFDQDLLDKEVYPRLQLNEYRPRFRAVSKTEPSAPARRTRHYCSYFFPVTRIPTGWRLVVHAAHASACGTQSSRVKGGITSPFPQESSTVNCRQPELLK